MNTISHRVYQTGKGERGSEDAANDLLLRIGEDLFSANDVQLNIF